MSHGGAAADRAGSDVLARLAAQVAAIETPTATTADDGDDPDGVLPEGGQAALTWLIRSITQRPLTVAEARDKLLARDHAPEVVDAVIHRAVTGRLLDDAAFSRAWVEDRGVKRGYGRARLGRELRRRKVDDDTISVALQALDDHDEVGHATELARARAQRIPATLEPHKVATRLVGFLVRRGYPGDVATRVARSVTAIDRDWD